MKADRSPRTRDAAVSDDEMPVVLLSLVMMHYVLVGRRT